MALNHFILNPTIGSFRSIDALNNYLQQLLNEISNSTTENNSQGITVEVRGSNNIVSSTTLNFNSQVKFIGNNGVLNFNGVATLNNLQLKDLSINITGTINVSNTIFDNCQFTVNPATGFSLGSNVQFSNCTFSYIYDATSDINFTTGQYGNPLKGCIFLQTSVNHIVSNINISNCIFNTSFINYFPFISFLIQDDTHYLENINIIDNKFNNTSGSEDQRAVLSIVSSLTVNPTSPQGPRLVGCEISNNICNKNQLLILSATLNNSNKITDMIVPVNVNITNNICGAICFLAKQDIPNLNTNTSSIKNVDSSLTIDHNSCKFIYCGFSSGFINISGSADRCISNILSGQNLYTTSTDITNNTCSWIYVGVRNPTTYSFNTPIFKVNYNKINAFNSSFLNGYYNGASPDSLGLIIDNQIGT